MVDIPQFDYAYIQTEVQTPDIYLAPLLLSQCTDIYYSNSLSNNISTNMYFKSKTKQYLLWCFNIKFSSVINYVMLTFSVKTLWMALYSIVGPISVRTKRQKTKIFIQLIP